MVCVSDPVSDALEPISLDAYYEHVFEASHDQPSSCLQGTEKLTSETSNEKATTSKVLEIPSTFNITTQNSGCSKLVFVYLSTSQLAVSERVS